MFFTILLLIIALSKTLLSNVFVPPKKHDLLMFILKVCFFEEDLRDTKESLNRKNYWKNLRTLLPPRSNFETNTGSVPSDLKRN